MTNQTYETSVSSFAVSALPGIEFDLYYLNSFTDSESVTKDGNYNSAINKFAGYEKSYDAANFLKVNFDDNGAVTNDPNPTSIDQLWPAHKLTYALVITQSSVSGLDLTSWSETTSESAKVDNDTYVSLSWAIDMYGAAFAVDATNNVLTDVATGYSTYYKPATHTSGFDYGRFNYSEALPAPETPVTLPIISSVPSVTAEQRSILYFTIEFSNNEGTYYLLNEETGFYDKSTSGNSNCYEGLQLQNLEFTLK